jgi:hypothetical protein
MQSEAGRQTARRAAFFHLKQAGVKAAHFRVAAHVGAVFAVQLEQRQGRAIPKRRQRAQVVDHHQGVA